MKGGHLAGAGCSPVPPGRGGWCGRRCHPCSDTSRVSPKVHAPARIVRCAFSRAPFAPLDPAGWAGSWSGARPDADAGADVRAPTRDAVSDVRAPASLPVPAAPSVPAPASGCRPPRDAAVTRSPPPGGPVWSGRHVAGSRRPSACAARPSCPTLAPDPRARPPCPAPVPERPAPGDTSGSGPSSGWPVAAGAVTWGRTQNAASSSSIRSRSTPSASLRAPVTPGRTFAAKNFAAAILPW